MPNHKKLMLKIGSTTRIFHPDDILYIQAEGAYTIICLIDGQKLTLSRNLNVIDSSLEDYGNFCRIHHSYLININHVAAYLGGKECSVRMSDDQILSVARGRKTDLLDCFYQL